MESYGLRVFEAGFVIHRDDGRLVDLGDGVVRAPGTLASGGKRGVIRAFTHASRRNLEFIAANASAEFKTIVTLTYHAKLESWEGDNERNLRIACRSKRDLNRFLSCVRRELGPYLWVQEFQQRGVIHYHLMCGGEPSQERLAMAWCRSTGELDDAAAVEHAVKVEAVRGERGVRSYLGRYLGKGRQKSLPPGIDGAGRWWGRSTRLPFKVRTEVVSREPDSPRSLLGVRVLRSVRRWLRHELGFRVTGGKFVDWGGRLSERLAGVAVALEAFYRPEWADRLGGVEFLGESGRGDAE